LEQGLLQVAEFLLKGLLHLASHFELGLQVQQVQGLSLEIRIGALVVSPLLWLPEVDVATEQAADVLKHLYFFGDVLRRLGQFEGGCFNLGRARQVASDFNLDPLDEIDQL